MLIFKTALKNNLYGSKQIWLNVLIIAVIFIIIQFIEGLELGWIDESKNESIKWEYAGGELWYKSYDPQDIFSITDAHSKIPVEFNKYIDNKKLLPILVVQATLYINNKPTNLIIKGILPNQNIIAIPSNYLTKSNENINVIINATQAKELNINTGNILSIKIRDKNGMYDYRELNVKHIFNTSVVPYSGIEIWMNLDDLQKITSMQNEATFFIRDKSLSFDLLDNSNWVKKDLNFLLKNINELKKSKEIGSIINFIILLVIALLPIFDSQVLSIFKRSKEIATLVALGLTPKEVSLIFTMEGLISSVMGIIIGLILCIPMFYILNHYGYPMPEVLTKTGIPLNDKIHPVWSIKRIVSFIFFILLFSGIISYIPTRKITRKNISSVLKGNT